MKRKTYTIEYVDADAGLAAFCPSTSDDELQRILPRVSLFETPSDQFLALSEPGPVRLMARTGTGEGQQHRVYVGIKDDKSKKIKLMPALGGQIVELGTRLHDVHYGRGDDAPVDLSDLAKRRSVNEDLVTAFGSMRRVRQLGAKAEGRVDATGVTSRDAIVDTIDAIGEAAERKGLTSAQVMAKVSGLRNIPAHNPLGATAQTAYDFAAIVPPDHWQDLNWKPLHKAFTKPGHLESLRAENSPLLADAFVDHMLGARRAEAQSAEGKARLKEASRWLALYNTCRSLLDMKRETRVDGGKLEEVPAAFAQKHGFHSPQAMHYFVTKYCTVAMVADFGNSVIQRTDYASHLLRNTMAVCAVRSFDNVVTPEMAAALLESMEKITLKEIMGFFREIGCKVKNVKTPDGTKCFHATLLSAAGAATGQEAITLQQCLPAIKKPGGPPTK